MYWKIITTPPFGLLQLRLRESKPFRQAIRQLRIHAAQETLSSGASRFGHANFQKGEFFWEK